MAKTRNLKDAEAEIAALRAQLAVATQTATDAPFQRFPCVMYKKHKVDEKHPNGYERRRVEDTAVNGDLDVSTCEASVVRLEHAGWVHSPADIA